MTDEGRKEEERKVKSFAKPLALPALRSWIGVLLHLWRVGCSFSVLFLTAWV